MIYAVYRLNESTGAQSLVSYDDLDEDHTDEEIEVMNDKVRQAFDISHRAEDEAVNLNALS